VASCKLDQSYPSKDTSRVAKKPARQKRPRLPSTPPNVTPDHITLSDQPSANRRSGRRQESSSFGGYVGPPPVVIFSGSTSIHDKSATMSAFERLGGKVVTAINDANILCIPDGPVKKTGKF